jgi:hypothetical protein
MKRSSSLPSISQASHSEEPVQGVWPLTPQEQRVKDLQELVDLIIDVEAHRVKFIQSLYVLYRPEERSMVAFINLYMEPLAKVKLQTCVGDRQARNRIRKHLGMGQEDKRLGGWIDRRLNGLKEIVEFICNREAQRPILQRPADDVASMTSFINLYMEPLTKTRATNKQSRDHIRKRLLEYKRVIMSEGET